MEASIDKRSMAHSHRTFNSTLAGGHRSDIASSRRHLVNRSGRRLFLFKGSTARRTPDPFVTSSYAAKPRRTPGVVSESLGRADKAAVAGSPTKKRRRLHSTTRTKRLSSGANHRRRRRSGVHDNKRDLKEDNADSRPESSVASPVIVFPEEPPPTEGATAVGAKDSNNARNPAEEVVNVTNPTTSDDKNNEDRLNLSPTNVKAPSTSSDSNDDDNKSLAEKNVLLSSSPAVVGYRKLVYNEATDKWVEHWKVEEDEDKLRVKRRQEAARARMARELAALLPGPPHKVKGRSTARFQVMFPTAIIRGNRRSGFINNINMTDPLRMELHKRKTPVVPTYFQKHILQFGKLPFRNNPRPHPLV